VPTIREVADAAGVSPATVSRVLNGYPHIREEVRQGVLEAVARLGYEPNRVAQRLRASRSRLVGIMVTDITNPFNNIVMAGMESVFFDHGFSVLMSNTDADPQKELDYLRLMENEGVAGLVIAPTSENVVRLEELAEAGLPIVVIDRRVNSPHVDVVLADNVAGARSAVEHLTQLGHKRIGHIGGPMRLTSGRERYQGYCDALRSAGLRVHPEHVRFGDHQFDSGYARALELLAVDPPPTALFIANNMMTLGALNAIHDRGKRIPHDVAVVGFDDVPWAVSLNPPLTAVAQPTREIGHQAARLLLERIDVPGLPARSVILETQLVVRESCGSPDRH
jgi:DNA-binding LacI/PurR family transcriptional regulator